MFGTFHKDYTLASFTPSGQSMATAMIITSTIFRCYLKSVRGDMVGICKQTTEYCINAHLCAKKFVKFKIKTFQRIFYFLLRFIVVGLLNMASPGVWAKHPRAKQIEIAAGLTFVDDEEIPIAFLRIAHVASENEQPSDVDSSEDEESTFESEEENDDSNGKEEHTTQI